MEPNVADIDACHPADYERIKRDPTYRPLIDGPLPEVDTDELGRPYPYFGIDLDPSGELNEKQAQAWIDTVVERAKDLNNWKLSYSCCYREATNWYHQMWHVFIRLIGKCDGERDPSLPKMSFPDDE